MQIILAAKAGFCSGVKRTLDLANKAAAQYGKVYTLGPLIHNPQEVKRLEGEGIIPIESLNEAQGFPVLIRSHGVPPKVYEEAAALNIPLIDATCPLVRKVQSLAAELKAAGHNLIIIGDAAHPEVIGISGWAGDKAIIIENCDQAQKLPFLENMAVISQTTQTEENFRLIEDILKTKTDFFTIHNTRCGATQIKQKEAMGLAAQVDVMLIIGGKNSSNTKKLAKICGFSGVPTYHLETADDLDFNLIRGKEKVGITAGASTPDWIIEEVIGKMSEFDKNCDMLELEPKEENLNNEESLKNDEPLKEEESLKEEEGLKEEESLNNEESLKTETIEEEVPQAPIVEEEGGKEECAEIACQEQAADTQGEEGQSFADAYNLDIKELRRGSRVKGVVVQVKNDEILVDIGGKSEGVLPAAELTPEDAANIKDRFTVGDEIEVLVLKRENQEGYPVLSKKRIDQEIAWDELSKKKEEGQIVEGKVLEVVKGGLLVDVGIRGFIPASLAALNYVEDLNTFIGKKMRLKILDCERNLNKLVLSAKAVLKAEAEKSKAETWANIQEGQTKRGIVCRLTSFGAFVDVGGVDGLLHVSEMAWYRVNHPSDLLKEGDEIDVYVLNVDPAAEKISLGLKQLVPNPWSLAKEKYPEGGIIQAKVVRTAPFGAFLEVEPGVEGLVHISQLAHYRVEKTEDVVKPGQIVEVKVLSVDPEAKRISLSIKGATPKPEEAPGAEAYGEAENAPADAGENPVTPEETESAEAPAEAAASAETTEAPVTGEPAEITASEEDAEIAASKETDEAPAEEETAEILPPEENAETPVSEEENREE